MKFALTSAFTRDLAKLAPEHQRLFRAAIHDHFLPAIEAGAFTGTPPWPPRLRIHQLAGTTTIYSLTWSFASPDGRATFQLETDTTTGDTVLIWRRIGTHRIYDQP